MKDLGFGLVDQRTVVIVLITALIAHLLLGFPFPIDTQSILSIFIYLFLLTGYLYIVRTFVRLPFAIAIGIYSVWKNKEESYYKFERSESFQKIERTIGWERFRRSKRFWLFFIVFFDQNNWKGLLGILDRMGVIITTILVTYPPFGVILLRGIGIFGLLVMLLIYIVSGSFGGLVEDAIKQASDARIKEHEQLVNAAGHPDIKIPKYPSSVSIRDDRYDNVSG